MVAGRAIGGRLQSAVQRRTRLSTNLTAALSIFLRRAIRRLLSVCPEATSAGPGKGDVCGKRPLCAGKAGVGLHRSDSSDPSDIRGG